MAIVPGNPLEAKKVTVSYLKQKAPNFIDHISPMINRQINLQSLITHFVELLIYVIQSI